MAIRATELPRRTHPGGPGIGLRVPRLSERLVFGLLGIFIVLPLWEAAVRLGFVRRVTLSAPSYIAQTAVGDLLSGALWPHLFVSAQEYVVGFLAAAVSGIILGLLLGLFRRLGYLFDPIVAAFYSTPVAALVPLVILIFGIGFVEKIAVIWLKAVFLILVSTMAGPRSADPRHLEIARSFGASRWRTFTSVILPTSVPYIITGLRLGAGQALVGLVIAEFLGANAGLGFYINFAGTAFRTDRVMFGIFILGLVGLAIGEGMRRLERSFERWRPQPA
jgi:ABC-type nitrate/sulfonate/bicarbonate transport system permease component